MPTDELEQVYADARASIGRAAESPIELAFRQVAPSIRVLALRTPTLPPAAHTSCYVLGPTTGAGELVVVDPGSPYADEQERLAQLLEQEASAGRTISKVILTHHHHDHVGGAVALRERFSVPIAAHADAAASLAHKFAVDEPLDDGDGIAAGNSQFLVIVTPGHARGHVCLLDGATAALVAGDMVAGIGTILIDPSDGDMTDYLASLERLISFAPSQLLPAHGPMITEPEAYLRGYIRHRLAREAKVLAAVTALPEVSLGELVAVAYADTPRALWALAERSLRSHLTRLQQLGTITATIVDGQPRWRLL